MVTYEPKESIEVKRDMDLLRDLMLRVEENEDMDFTREFPCGCPELDIPGKSPDELAYHITMLVDYGYFKGNSDIPSVSGLTMEGHDFLGTIKDPGIWSKTKENFKNASGIALPVIAKFALTELMKRFGLHD